MSIVERHVARLLSRPPTDFDFLIPSTKDLLDADECEIYADHLERHGMLKIATMWRAEAVRRRLEGTP